MGVTLSYRNNHSHLSYLRSSIIINNLHNWNSQSVYFSVRDAKEKNKNMWGGEREKKFRRAADGEPNLNDVNMNQQVVPVWFIG